MGAFVIDSWPEELDAQLTKARGKKFVWGKCDCCLWAADVVEALTGVDYAAEFRGKYKTITGAKKALGKRTLRTIMNKKLPKIKHPHRGDVVLIPRSITKQELPALGICIGMQVAMMGDGGLEFLPVSVITGAWSIHDG